MQPSDKATAFESLACLRYAGDDPANWDRAAAMWQSSPDLAQSNIWCAAAAGHVDWVEYWLDREPELLNQTGGALDWEPLLYATYSRLQGPEFDTTGVVRTLLARGANPNAHFMWDGIYRFTALTGVFGHGESGPSRQPEHPGGLALARILLEAGADPADGQALYNRMFADTDSACLRLLLEFGLNATHCNNWFSVGPGRELSENTELALSYQLRWAVENHWPERAHLLLKAGAVPQAAPGGAPLYTTAVMMGYPTLAQALAEAGAPTPALSPIEQLAGACMAGDLNGARRLIEQDPKRCEQLQQQHANLLHKAAAGNRVEAIRTLHAIGFKVDRMLKNAPLHEAAWHGKKQAAAVLIECGASLDLTDPTHGGTPANWAAHAGHVKLSAWLQDRAEKGAN